MSAGKADIWMPLYVADYLKDTGHLGHAEHGCYLLLLAQSWVTGPLPSDEVSLSRLARCPLKEWRKIAPVVLAFFEKVEGKLISPRLERERADAQGNAERRSKKAADAAAARWAKQSEEQCSEHAPSMPQAMRQECPSPSPSEVPSETTSLRGPHKRGCRLPDDWQPDEMDSHFARSEGLVPAQVAAQFRDYWHAKAGRDACKLDWSATWRRWCRTEAERAKPKESRLAYLREFNRSDDDRTITVFPDLKALPQ